MITPSRAASLLVLWASGAALAQPTNYTIDFFPELPVNGSQLSLAFDPRLAEPALDGAQVISTRVVIGFTTTGDFDAGALVLQLTSPIAGSPTGGTLLLSGADLGWSGQGTFQADFVTDSLNGAIPSGGRAPWFFDLFGGDNEFFAFSGSFTDDSRIVLTYVPVAPPPPCLADFNRDGVLNPDDLADFIAGFFTDPPDPLTDANADGVIDPDDLADFIAAYFVGCP